MLNFNYIDPGTGSMLISATIAMISVLFFIVKGFIYRTFGLGGDKGDSVDLQNDYGVLFYSEGSQYWIVFQSIISETLDQGISINYFTSDKNDEGLRFKHDNFNAYYIGSGREAYYILNRIKCDIFVLTTPGLDVLELKRSPHVKHYIHIGHTLGSVSGYKAYGTDYYDSVLVGGKGDVSVIRELENKRNLPEKNVEIIGHTYLDILIKNLNLLNNRTNYFNNGKKTILISPTWGNHGLLTKYGNYLLTELTYSNDYNLIIRPHPQSFVSDKELIDELLAKFPNSDNLIWETSGGNLTSMYESDLMISDFSGIVFDYISLFNKPCLTMASNYDRRGRDSMDIEGDLWNLKLIEKLTYSITEKNVTDIVNIVEKELIVDHTDLRKKESLKVMSMHDGNAGYKGAKFIKKTLLSMNTDNPVSSKVVKEDSVNNYATGKLLSDSKGLLFNINFIFQLIFVIGILAISSSTIILLVQPGLNNKFFTFVLKTVSLASILPILWSLFLLWRDTNKVISISISKARFPKELIILVLLPLIPIVQYTILNQDILNLNNSVILILLFLLISIVIIVFIPFILSPIIMTNLSGSFMVTILFTLFNMASFGRTTRYLVIVFVMILLTISIFFMMRYKQTKTISIILVLLLITNSISSYMEYNNNSDSSLGDNQEIVSESKLFNIISGKSLVNTPNIYLMVYDSYSNQETWDSYGFDNNDQMQYLLENDFAIYDGTYSVAPASLSSMSHVLNPQPLVRNNKVYRENIANSPVVSLLNENNYATRLVLNSTYMVSGTDTVYDTFLPGDFSSIAPYRIISDAIFEGEFRFDAEFSDLDGYDYFEAKKKYLSDNTKPSFIYFHDSYPGHTQNSGELLPDEDKLIFSRLTKANLEMKKNIEEIYRIDKNAIIIILGDHGPYLTKNGTNIKAEYYDEVTRQDIQDRFGTFLAIKWPDKSYNNKYEIKLIQDVMPAVLSYMYEDASIFELSKMDRTIILPNVVGGVKVEEGIIIGGVDSGKQLFEINGVREK